jgi:hypothetical protein
LNEEEKFLQYTWDVISEPETGVSSTSRLELCGEMVLHPGHFTIFHLKATKIMRSERVVA